MTRELLQEANKLNHAINDLKGMISVAEDMHHCGSALILEVESIGAITIAWDDELKGDIIDMVLRRLNDRHEDMEDKLRLL